MIDTFRTNFRATLEKLQQEQAMGDSITSARGPRGCRQQKETEETVRSECPAVGHLQNASGATDSNGHRSKRRSYAERDCEEIAREDDVVYAGGHSSAEGWMQGRAAKDDDHANGADARKLPRRDRGEGLDNKKSIKGMDAQIVVDEDDAREGNVKKSLGQRWLDPVISFGGKVAGGSLLSPERLLSLISTREFVRN